MPVTPIASQGEYSDRFLLIDTTMATTTLSNVVDGRGLTLVGLELPASVTGGNANIQEMPRFAGGSPITLVKEDGTSITIVHTTSARIYRWSPLLFPAVGKITLSLASGTMTAGSTIGFLFIKPQGER